MNAADMKTLWQMIANQARTTAVILSLEDLLKLKTEFERAEALGPILDPTAYMKMDREAVRENKELLDATIAYVSTIFRIDAARRVRQGKPPLKPAEAAAE